MNLQRILLLLGLNKEYFYLRFCNPVFISYVQALLSRAKTKRFLDKNQALFDELQLRFPNECVLLWSEYLGDWGAVLVTSIDNFPEVPESLWDKWRATPSSRTLFQSKSLSNPKIIPEEMWLLDFLIRAQHQLLYIDYVVWLSFRPFLIILFI